MPPNKPTPPTIRLIDANNSLRRAFEASKTVSEVVPFQSPEIRIYVFDGFNSKAPRLAIYPEYKAKRDTYTPKVNGAYEHMDAIRKELLPHLGASTFIVRLDGYEADDVIAYLAKKYSASGNVIIDSNDGDFWTLTQKEQVEETHAIKTLGMCPDLLKFPYQGSITLLQPPKWTAWITPNEVRLYKTLVGDSSDNIGGLAGFGEKGFQSLSAIQKGTLNKFFTEYEQYTDPEGFIQTHLFGYFKPAAMSWFLANHKQLHTFWQVIGFMPLHAGQIAAAMKLSVPNSALYWETMNKYMWD